MKVHKKRGRKPKGGKIVDIPNKLVDNSVLEIQNIILHLKVTASKLSNTAAYIYEPINSIREYKEIEIQKEPTISIQDKLKELKISIKTKIELKLTINKQIVINI